MHNSPHPTPDLDPSASLLEMAAWHRRRGELQQAEALCREILRTQPSRAEAWHELGRVNHEMGQTGIAAALLGKAAALQPDSPDIRHSLALAQLFLGLPSRAEASFRQTLELEPRHRQARAHLGGALLNQGRQGEAVACFKDALINGYADSPSNYLFALHYLPDFDREQLFDEARRWGMTYTRSRPRLWSMYENSPRMSRRLRVGYVSADFRRHPVGDVIASVLPAHAPDQIETFCYASQRHNDALTERIRSCADHWVSIVAMSDEEAATAIHADAIDILVDLSGHSGGNRLGIFALKPAPVQAMWLGYFDTTGMPTMDYVLADPFVCPPNDDRFYVEQVVRLPDAFLCYRPDTSVEVTQLPASTTGYVTFGCFNNLSKVTPAVVRVWSEILRVLPNARIHLKANGFDDVAARDRFLQMFVGNGVQGSQVTFEGRTDYAQYFTAYCNVDIALDPFPYNGGATSVEALWMGVPVISLEGDRFVGRMGGSLLSAAGLPELIASSPRDYVRKAIGLANDLPRLAKLRESLRCRLASSPVCDEHGFTRGLEAAYRGMWSTWCETRLRESSNVEVAT